MNVELKKTENKLKEQLERSDAINRCYSLGKRFIGHFDKIYKNPLAQDVNRYCMEMQAWYNQVKVITLKEDKKTLSKNCLIDWFFTATGNPDNFMINPTREELDDYNDFTYKVLLNHNVKSDINDVIRKLKGEYMSLPNNKKLSILYTLQILKDYSDEKHLLSQNEIAKKIYNLYGMECERKSIGTNIDSLIDFGYDIVKTNSGCFLASREFEASEIRFLIDAVS